MLIFETSLKQTKMLIFDSELMRDNHFLTVFEGNFGRA